MYKTEQLLDDETKDKDYTVVMGDFNAVVGEGKEDVYVGHYGLAYCNDNGQMLVDFCKKRQDVHVHVYCYYLRTEDIDTRGRNLESQEGIR